MHRRRRQTRASKRNRERALNNALARRIEAVEGEPIRQRARVQSPLERYHQRKMLTDEQFAAGVRLARDFELAARILGPAPVRAQSFELLPRSPLNREISEAQVGRIERYRRSVDALPPQLQPLVLAVCCHEQTVQEWASCYTGVSRHHAVGWLTLGLEILGSRGDRVSTSQGDRPDNRCPSSASARSSGLIETPTDGGTSCRPCRMLSRKTSCGRQTGALPGPGRATPSADRGSWLAGRSPAQFRQNAQPPHDHASGSMRRSPR